MTAVRDRLSGEYIRSRSSDIVRNLMSIPELTGARHLLVYASFRSEVRTRELMQTLLDGGSQVSVPVVIRQDPALRAARVHCLQDLVPGALGIPEPHPDALELTDIGALDAVIVPGLAFDRHGWRIGYGGGYYDRLLRQTQARTWGLAFDVQVLDAVPHVSAHDVPIETIVTETRILACV
jgi:5-formyltetrahydrofolate cyclo-ligase